MIIAAANAHTNGNISDHLIISDFKEVLSDHLFTPVHLKPVFLYKKTIGLSHAYLPVRMFSISTVLPAYENIWFTDMNII